MSLGEKMFHGHYEVGPDPIFCPQNVDLTLDLVLYAGSSPPKAAHRSLLDASWGALGAEVLAWLRDGC